MEIDKYVPDFQARVDKNAEPDAVLHGEFGPITRIMYNKIIDIYYYLHYRRAWFWTFGKLFGARIPLSDNGRGTSVSVKELDHANARNSYMVLRYEGTYFGCHVRDWIDYVKRYNTLWNKKEIDNLVEGCIPIKMLFDMEGFKN